MKSILVIGGGGREHAICLALKKSKNVSKIYCAPGNAGIADIAECLPFSAMDFDKITAFALENKVDLVFVAPDDPLASGLVDILTEKGIRAFGPSKLAAEIEASKSYSKDFMKKYNIPTAAYAKFTDFHEAKKYAESASLPLVVKADGLALGKGVIICNTKEEAVAALDDIMVKRVFGKAGGAVVIEEFLVGKEMTVLCFADGETFSVMPPSQDHKRAYDNDKGLNTGGMGAFAPTAVYTAERANEIERDIIIPTLDGLKKEGRAFKGVIYFGLMATDNGVKVIEYNARFGDPETQVVLPLLKTDFLTIVEAVIDGRLKEIDIKWRKKSALTVVIASGGYPENVIKGYPITIDKLPKSLFLYHSGTARNEKNELVTNGGRVFCLTAYGKNIAAARKKVYSKIGAIKFQDARFRSDIGLKN